MAIQQNMKFCKVFLSALIAASVVYRASAQTTMTNTFSGLNIPVPDGNTIGVSDTEVLNFADPTFNFITNLQVILTLTNGYNGDLYAYLTHGTGFAVLLNRVGKTAGSPGGYSDPGMDVVFTATGADIHNYQSEGPTFNGAGQLTGSWGADGRTTNPVHTLDTDPQNASLLGSFYGTDPNGSWTVFLADLSGGEQSTLTQWGVIVTAVPEPSTFALLGLGGLFTLRHLRRRK